MQLHPFIIACLWVIAFFSGFALHAFVFPQNPVKEVEVEKFIEVEKIIEIETTQESRYEKCVHLARTVLYSSWNGAPLEGTTPENTQAFVRDCFEMVK